jgi:hypothetical protein
MWGDPDWSRGNVVMRRTVAISVPGLRARADLREATWSGWTDSAADEVVSMGPGNGNARFDRPRVRGD